MINVYSFQKMLTLQDCPQPKNISKTSHFTFGQNYRKLVSNPKGSFDFRKLLQKSNHNKKHIPFRQEAIRNPLQQVASTQGNAQSLLYSKAFKIRCYSRKAKQNQKSQDEGTILKMAKYRPKIYQMREKKAHSTVKKIAVQNKKCLRMHKFDNFQELQSIAAPIKIVYNDFISQSDKYTDKAIIIDINYLTNCLKSSSLKSNQKDKDRQYFRKKIVFILKRIIQDRFSQFPLERTSSEERPQIIFKVSKQQQICDLIQAFQQYEFNTYYCIFSIQNKFIQSLGTYNLTKITLLAQNILILDSQQSFNQNIPLINSRHFVAFTTFLQKANFSNALEDIFDGLQNLQIRFSAQEFEIQDKNSGFVIQIPVKKLLAKVNRKKTLKSCKRSSRSNRQTSSISSQSRKTMNQVKSRQSNLENFKQKILKYLKIVGNECPLDAKRSKQLLNNQEFQCMTGRQQNSKTNNQIVSQLIRINNNVHKQICNYQKKMQEFEIERRDQKSEMIHYLRFEKIFVNTIA